MSDDQTGIELDDLIILLLGAPAPDGVRRGRMEGITRLEKLLFLVEKELRPEWMSERGDFASYKFGPFSPKVYTAVDTLAAYGLITDSGSIDTSREDSWEAENIIGQPSADPYATRKFELTKDGREYYEVLRRQLPKDAETQLAEFKRHFVTLPLRSLVRYVYERFPEFTDKSEIRDDIMR